MHSRRLAICKNALASTGIIRAEPGSTNTVPGRVYFSLDIRAGDDKTLLELEEQLKDDFDRIAGGASADGLSDGGISGQPCFVEWTLDAPSAAVKFNSGCIDCVRQSSEALLGDHLVQDMISGAGEGFVLSRALGAG